MAISQAVAQAILNQQEPDIVGQFQQGQKIAQQRQDRSRQDKIRELSGMAAQGDTEALDSLSGIAPEVAFKMRQAIGAEDDAALARFIDDAKVGEQLLAGGNTQGFLAFAEQRSNAIRRMGGDTAQTDRIAALVRAGQVDEALNELTAFTTATDQARQVGDTPRQREFAQFAAMPEDTEQQRLEKQQFGTAIGAIGKIKDRASAETLRREEFAKAEGKATGSGVGGRQQEFINKGVEAADSTANIRRSIDLLKSVSTGGIDAANIRAKQAFGVEGADEGELSNALGTAVLSQLKATFGSAFTEAEGARLERLSAGIKKSPAANRRILEQALKIAEKSARRGIKAARAKGDQETADQIQESLDFVLSDAEPQAPQQAAPQAQGQQVGRFTVRVK